MPGQKASAEPDSPPFSLFAHLPPGKIYLRSQSPGFLQHWQNPQQQTLLSPWYLFPVHQLLLSHFPHQAMADLEKVGEALCQK